CEGFDFGNSPTHIINENFEGKSVILTTSSGTKGIANALNADQIITGSFVNVKAIAKYIMLQNPKEVTLVGMGYEGLRVTQEDEFCADYIANEILSIKTDLEKIKTILKSGDGARLFNPENQAHSPLSDFFLCTDFNRFDFVLKVISDENGNKLLEKIDII
ncbi:MAG: 2-phosphosulfolactate phosphatase, partial [Prolixibacteraceae bacterium]|nr:2-phosphosulfolactate phosphatase [Prolixibacteraceae bacterium]